MIVNGTSGDDIIQVVGDASGASAVGLAARVNITGAEAATDRLIVNALAGEDVVDGTGLAAGAIQLTSVGIWKLASEDPLALHGFKESMEAG